MLVVGLLRLSVLLVPSPLAPSIPPPSSMVTLTCARCLLPRDIPSTAPPRHATRQLQLLLVMVMVMIMMLLALLLMVMMVMVVLLLVVVVVPARSWS